MHTASPVGLGADEPDDFIVPAVQGVLGALRAAARSPSVKRAVSISSCVTIVDETATSPRVYDETCWNEDYVPEVEAKGRAASGMAKYGASKIIAERKGWEFYEQAKAGGAAPSAGVKSPTPSEVPDDRSEVGDPYVPVIVRPLVVADCHDARRRPDTPIRAGTPVSVAPSTTTTPVIPCALPKGR